MPFLRGNFQGSLYSILIFWNISQAASPMDRFEKETERSEKHRTQKNVWYKRDVWTTQGKGEGKQPVQGTGRLSECRPFFMAERKTEYQLWHCKLRKRRVRLYERLSSGWQSGNMWNSIWQDQEEKTGRKKIDSEFPWTKNLSFCELFLKKSKTVRCMPQSMLYFWPERYWSMEE